MPERRAEALARLVQEPFGCPMSWAAARDGLRRKSSVIGFEAGGLPQSAVGVLALRTCQDELVIQILQNNSDASGFKYTVSAEMVLP